MTLRSTALGADNVLLFILVWTFTAVCQADNDVCSVSCEDVTGAVGEEVTFTCSVSQKCTECCITMYKFGYPKIYNGSTICRQDLPLDSCEQRNNFTCRYTPTTEMTGHFRFLMQTTCELKLTEFTVGITEPSKQTGPEDPGHGSTAPMFPGAVVGCFIIIIIFIIVMSVFCVKRFKCSKPSGLQMKYERGASEEPTITTVNDQNETK